VLTDHPDIKFKVDNFTLDNMLEIERQWDHISESLLTSTKLLAEFGLSGDSLSAQNVIIPVAYYIKKWSLPENFVHLPKYQNDREKIRLWVIRSMLRAGFWTGAVDAILLRTREIIRGSKQGFPLLRIESELAAQGKSMDFGDSEIEDLLYTKYGHRNAFLLLTLLYPGIDVGKTYHVDHIFPKSLFTSRKLTEIGVAPADVVDWMAWANFLPNLQLLEGNRNQAKSSLLPSEWVSQHLSAAQRKQYESIHDLAPLPSDLRGFEDFWDRRYAAMEVRLRKLLT
jgi:hypothetical protein